MLSDCSQCEGFQTGPHAGGLIFLVTIWAQVFALVTGAGLRLGMNQLEAAPQCGFWHKV